MSIQPRLFAVPQIGETSDDYFTPKWIFDALDFVFDIDVAAPPEGPPHTPCKAYYTQESDGLGSPWRGSVWMNPPYSKPQPWVARFMEHGNGMALLPFTRAKWHDDLWQSECAVAAIGREPSGGLLRFDRANGKPIGIFMPVCLWAIGDKCIDALHRSKIGRVR
jgi:hypothetical protein